MSRGAPLLPLPFSPFAANIVTGSLDDAFEAMLFDPPDVSPDNFSNEWGATDTEEALASSSVNDTRLKHCNVAGSASVVGIPVMCPAQLEACYCLLHPHHPNALVMVHGRGGGRHTYSRLLVWSNAVFFNFHFAAHPICRHDAYIWRSHFYMG